MTTETPDTNADDREQRDTALRDAGRLRREAMREAGASEYRDLLRAAGSDLERRP